MNTTWRPLRVDLLPRGRGVFDSGYYSPEGFGWYRCELQLTRENAAPGLPGLFNDAWLYVNGHLVDFREQKEDAFHLLQATVDLPDHRTLKLADLHFPNARSGPQLTTSWNSTTGRWTSWTSSTETPRRHSTLT